MQQQVQEVDGDRTVAEVAVELRIRRDAVVQLLLSGLLKGYDAALPGARKRSFRISRQAIEEFKNRRSAKQEPTPQRRNRPSPRSDVKEYF